MDTNTINYCHECDTTHNVDYIFLQYHSLLNDNLICARGMVDRARTRKNEEQQSGDDADSNVELHIKEGDLVDLLLSGHGRHLADHSVHLFDAMRVASM